MKKTSCYPKSLLPSIGILQWCLALMFLAIALPSCKKKDHAVFPPITVQNFYPNSGNAGTLVKIQGTGFSSRLEDNKVLFAGHPASVVAVDSGVMVVQVPNNGVTGLVTVNNGGSQTAEVGKFTYQDLTISRVNPSNGPAGSHISIYGSGFSSVIRPATVKINGKNAVISSLNDTVLVVEIPVNAGSGPIEVFVDGKSVRGPDFNYQSILAVKPLSGGAGTYVRITGEGFGSNPSLIVVDFNGKIAKIVQATSTSILVQAPDGVQSGPIAVTVNGQRATGPSFTVVPPPVIDLVSPLSGYQGVVMSITGAYFSDSLNENHVYINGREMPLQSANKTLIRLVLPASPGSGPIILSVNDQQVAGPQFKEQALYIDSLSPNNGLAGDLVTIYGSGFSGTVSGNTVTFNGLPATVTKASATSVSVIVPNNVSSGDVKLSTGGLEAIAPGGFKRAGFFTVAYGVGPNTAGIAADNNGNVYVIQPPGKIVKVSPQGVTTDFVGAAAAGFTDGQGAQAAFSFTMDSRIIFDHVGNFYVTDLGNYAIRKISLGGLVGTIRYGITNKGPLQLSADRSKIVTIDNARTMNRISLDGNYLETVKPVSPFNFGYANSFVLDKNDGVYYTNAYFSDPWAVEGYISYNSITAAENKLYYFNSRIITLLPNIDGASIYGLQGYNILKFNMGTGIVTPLYNGSYGELDGNFRTAQNIGFEARCSTVADDGTLYFVTLSGKLRKVLFQ